MPSCATLTYAELAEENLYLRRQLGLDRDKDMALRLQKAIGVSTRESRVLAALIAASGRVVTTYDLFESMDSTATDERGAVKVAICHIRQRLGRHAIEGYSGVGYALSREGRSTIENLKSTIAIEDAPRRWR